MATFGGAADYHILSGGPAIITPNSLTIAMWLRVDVDQNISTGMIDVECAANAGLRIGIPLDVDGTTFQKEVSGNRVNGVSATVSSWYFACAAYDDAAVNGGFFYWSLGLAGLSSSAQDFNGVAAVAGATSLFIGGDPTEGDSQVSIEGVKIWTTALTPTQVAQEQASWTVVNAANLWAWYQLTSASTTDNSGNGHTLTATGTPTNTTGAHSPLAPAGGVTVAWIRA